ncbi:MAG: hypothetical protein KC535_06120 [Nanoarchaeota archaeon]|nr:hypothetical protein [Nanoarchaeota archaeon]
MGFNTARKILDVFRLINKERASVASQVFEYTYEIDNAVDGELDVEESKILLLEERIEIQKAKTQLSKHPFLNNISKVNPQTSELIYTGLDRMIDAFKCDVQIRESKTPLSEKQLRERNYLMNGTPFHLAYEFIHDEPFKEPAQLPELIYYWTIYDALKDLEEDIQNKIYLLPKEKMEAYRVEKENIRTYDKLKQDLKLESSRKMYKLAPIFKDSNMNRVEELILRSYFISRSLKAKHI